MDSAQELFNDQLMKGWTRVTVQDKDDLPDRIRGDALWIKPSLSINGNQIPASYHALHNNEYYPIEFVNGEWYWLDWDDGQYLGYWFEPGKIIPQGDKGLGWLGKGAEFPILTLGGSFTTPRDRAESASTQAQEEPVAPVEDEDFVDTNPAQSEALAQEFGDQPIFGDIAEAIDPPQDRTHYLPTTLGPGARFNPVAINPIWARSTTTKGPTAPIAPEILAATTDVAKLITNSIKVDGQLKGRVPDTFDGDHTKTQKFMNSFNLFWMTNEDSSAMKVAYWWCTFFLGLLQGPKVDDWVLDQAVKLRARVSTGTQKTDEALWTRLKQNFENAFAHMGRVKQARMEL